MHMVYRFLPGVLFVAWILPASVAGAGSLTVRVETVPALRAAIAAAVPGTIIEIAGSVHDLAGVPIATNAAGSAQAPITIRAVSDGVALRTNRAEEAFLIRHPWYVFEDLIIEVDGGAVCNAAGGGSCHAYKLDAGAHDVIIRGGRMVLSPGAESGIKGSSPGTAGPYVDDVLIEGTQIHFTAPSVFVVTEGIDAIGVRNWTIRDNLIHGIRSATPGSVAWGIVLKGNSQDCVIERNVFHDNDVSISLGGTTAPSFMRDGQTQFEHRRGIVRNNVSVDTRDVALYLERAANSRIEHNTFISTSNNGGISAIDIRYAGSTAQVRNNLTDKQVLDREGGSHTAATNVRLDGVTLDASMFVDAASRDLRPRPGTALAQALVDRGTAIADVVDDLQSRPRPLGNGHDVGAYESEAAGTAGPAELKLAREDGSGLPGMYGGSWGAADFDGDGDVDLAVIGHFRTMFHSSDNPGGGSEELRLYANVTAPGGPIRFQWQATLDNDNGNRGANLVTGNFDGDARPDFAVQMRNGGNVAAFFNRGGWSFERRTLDFANNSNSLGMAATDVDRDGRDDLVFISDGGVGAGLWYRWDTGTSAWQARQRDFIHAISYGGTLAAGDLDGDAYPDIAVGGNSGQPFGAHDCGLGATIPSGERLQYGQTHRNLAGAGFALPAMAVVGAWGYKVPDAVRSDIDSCHGMDNAQMAIADLDGDGANDVVIAGSSTGQNGPVGLNGQQYDFAVLFNDGSGTAFEIWEHTGVQDPDGTTNGGVGNLDFPGIAIADFSGDGLPDVFVQGHRRDYDIATNPYVFEDLLFVNGGDRSFRSVPLDGFLPRFGASEPLPGGGADGSLSLDYLRGRPRYVAEGGAVTADFNGDGGADLIFSGAELPYHTNGSNFRDFNDTPTLRTYVLASTSPLFRDGFED